MDKVRITKSMSADGPDGLPRAYSAGDVVPAGAVLPGCLASMLRLGQAVPADAPDPAEQFAAAMEAGPSEAPPADAPAGPQTPAPPPPAGELTAGPPGPPKPKKK